MEVIVLSVCIAIIYIAWKKCQRDTVELRRLINNVVIYSAKASEALLNKAAAKRSWLEEHRKREK